MTGDQVGHLLYLLILGAVLGAWVFVHGRASISRTMQHMAAWGLIFIGAFAAVGLWQDIRGSVLPQQMVFDEGGRIELPRAKDGHYYVTLDINGAPVRFVVDTGASSMVLTRSAAEKAGLDPERLHFLTEAMTANGKVQTARVVLDSVSLGPFTDPRVPAYVNAGEMQNSLLGMSYLDRFSRLEISGGKLVLQR
jgi:aspartyl protease family protein